jgi:hypothetical protein
MQNASNDPEKFCVTFECVTELLNDVNEGTRESFFFGVWIF